jgi:hypothetical protein
MLISDPFSLNRYHADSGHQDRINGILSNHAANHLSSTTIKISALVPALLVALTTAIDLPTSPLPTIHRVYRLISLTIAVKPDTALDLLKIVATGHSGSRQTAIELLATFYPNCMGHNTIARRLARSTYQTQRIRWETGNDRALAEDEDQQHEYIPWRKSHSHNSDDDNISPCSVCEADLDGFCIRCTLCSDIRHLRCHHGGEEVFRYAIGDSRAASRLTEILVNRCRPPRAELLSDAHVDHGDRRPSRKTVGQHDFHLATLFVTTLCQECSLPIWELTRQAYACFGGCQKIVHLTCLERLQHSNRAKCNAKPTIHDHFSVRSTDLLRSFEQHISRAIGSLQLEGKTYDEVAVLYQVMWLQREYLINGLVTNALCLNTDTDDPLGLDMFLNKCGSFLQSMARSVSTAGTTFADTTGADSSPVANYLFSEEFLAHLIGVIQTPSPSKSLPGFSVTGPDDDARSPEPEDRATYESLDLTTIKRVLAEDVNIHDHYIAAILVDQLQTTGFLDLLPTQPGHVSHIYSFTLPLLVAPSPSVEILVMAIESLLEDLSLSQNEQALRLLTKRAWPSQLCSTYALEQLGSCLLRWILAEVRCVMHLSLTLGRPSASDRKTIRQ